MGRGHAAITLAVWLAGLSVVGVGPGMAARALAQPPADLSMLLGQTVTAIQVEIEGQPVTDPALLALLEVQVGAPLQGEAVRESLTHLFTSGRFEDVAVTAEPESGGVRIVFGLIPVHPIDRMEFRGSLGLDRRTLERGVLEQFGGRASTARLDAARDAVTRILVDEGFSRPVVTPSLEQTHDVHRSTLVLTVDAGPRLRIRQVQVAGTHPLPVVDVTTRIGLIAGAPYRRLATENSLRAVGDRLRSMRYYEASASHFATPVGDDMVDVTVTMDAGPIVQIVVTGDPLPPGGEDVWIPIQRENSADDDLLEDSAFRIRQALQREGYWRAQVTAQRAEDSGGERMTVTFTVERGLRYRLAMLTMEGQQHFSEADVLALLEIQPGDIFVESVLEERLGAVLRAYAFSGFDASLEYTAESLPVEEGRVAVHLVISEGPLRVVSGVTITGASQIGEDEVRRVVRSQVDQPLRDAQVREDRIAIQQLYLDRGFQSVVVGARQSTEAPFDVVFEIVEGPQTIVNHLIVVGNRRVDTETILAEVMLRPGQPFGQAARLDSQRRLADLATFRRITITQANEGRGDGRVDVIVQVEEAPATTVGYGAGLEFGRRLRAAVGGGSEDAFRFAPRGFVELGRRNLFGGNRSATLFMRASLGSRNDPDDPERDGRGVALSEYRVTGSYRAPRAFGLRIDGVLSATVERAIRTSFTFARRSVNAEGLHRVSSFTSVFARYALDSTELFETRIPEDDQPLIDRLFPQIRLSTVSAGLVWDRRDDLLDPTAGGLMSIDGEVAARSLGSEVGFVKVFGQAFGFRRLTRVNRVVIGGRVQVGVARGFTREVPIPGTDGETERVADLPAGRRFFSGGGTSVRGFQQDRLGVPGVINQDGLSNGGNGVIVLNGEVRTQLWTDIAVVGFVDGGNVFARAGDMSLAQLRGAAGVGLRYRSPLGPLRLDVGFKFDRRMVSGRRERAWEFHLSIGEVF
jgi:outer membrane protein assembly factor BamA